MDCHLNRREFLATAAASAALASATRGIAAPFKTKLQKALIGVPTPETLAAWKEAGFAGMETAAWDVAPEEAEKGRGVAEKLGMKIHSVLRGWTNFNSEDAAVVQQDMATVEKSLHAAQAYGADALLLVPCRIGGMPMPEAWEFQIDFDEKTGHVRKVAAGDNSRYQEYIAAHNRATDTSRQAVRKLIPVAEKTGSSLRWRTCGTTSGFSRPYSRTSSPLSIIPWVQAYFDIGNHVKYAKPEDWIRTLGKLIVKCHVKDFQLNPNGQGGEFVDIRDGSIGWPAVRQCLDEIGYNGWMTIEGSGNLALGDRSRRLDAIIAGQ